MPACVCRIRCRSETSSNPATAPNGPVVTGLGVTYVGNGNNYGAMPEPGKIIIDDITKWRDKLKIVDVSDRDWESYHKISGPSTGTGTAFPSPAATTS